MGLFRSGAPFSGAISFLLTSPVLNPAILALLLVFFGPVPTAVYAVLAFAFAVVAGLVLDALGFSRYVKNVSIQGGAQDGATWETLEGTFWQKQRQAVLISLKEAVGLFRGGVGWLLLGAGIGALTGAIVKHGVDKDFQDRVRNLLSTDDSAAVFMVVDEMTTDKFIDAIRPFGGDVLQTSLSIKDEEELKHELFKN